MNLIKNLLNLIQIISVFMIPVAACHQLLPELTFLGFMTSFNTSAISMFSKFTPMVIGGIDWTLVFVTLPWVLYIILVGFIIKLIDGLNQSVEEAVITHKKRKITELNQAQAQKERGELEKKQFTYLAVNLVFSKFTISYLSDSEVEERKIKVKKSILSDLQSQRGKLLNDEEFDDENTFAVIFYSQDDAISFIIKLKEQIRLLDSDMQDCGYSLGYRAMMDAQPPEAISFYVLQFLEKALRAVELNETCVTSSFADRYKQFGKNASFDFISKGNYSINKERVELKKLEY